jgi:hypothetical protein
MESVPAILRPGKSYQLLVAYRLALAYAIHKARLFALLAPG